MSLYKFATRGQLHPALDREWLLTIGNGGFASGTVVGCNRRRYHGLLCVSNKPPVARVMLLSRIGEMLIDTAAPDRHLEFSINQFSESFHPRGEQYLQTFELDEIARWTYDVEGVQIIKELQLPWMKNAAILRYTITPPPGKHFEFRMYPFLALRDFHSLRRGASDFDFKQSDKSVQFTADNNTIHLSSDPGVYVHKPDWWFGHTYSLESERGLDFVEDLFNPGWFSITVDAPTTVFLHAGQTAEHLDWETELTNRRRAVGSVPTHTPTIKRLVRAANDFVVSKKAPDGTDGSTIIAGYPWFSDWGRDTMISLPGLLLTTKRFAQAKQVLGVFAQYVSEGMIPNVFNDYTGKPEYNTVDASLWFVHAAFEYARHSGDKKTFDDVFRPACRQIIDGYRTGTRYNIKMDEADGLINQGDANTQLTWMDGKCDNVAFTPRQGKPVEINALWHNALVLMDEHRLAQKVADNFRRAFWISPFRGLADVVEGSPPGAESPYPKRDLTIRPNQIFAVSLPHSPLSDEQRSAVVEVVRRELLTPMGLRTLARNERGYQGRYHGGPFQRDSAYHNGTVWPWLIGPFVEAYLRVHGRDTAPVEQARRWLAPLLESMETFCIGQIGEINDGDPPHRSVGAIAQAWSVAEVLRLATELEM